MKVKNYLKLMSLSTMFFMAIGLYNCKPTPSEPEVPKFEEGYKDVKLPEITPTTPVAVTVTEGSIQQSAAVTDLANDLASGTITPAVTAAVTSMEKIISADEAAKLTAAFTPEIIATMDSGGTIPANLKAQLDAIASNPAFAAYTVTITYPTVNGKVVTGFVKETNTIGNESIGVFPDFAVAQINSPCTDSARAAYNRARATLDAARIAQRDPITSTYNSAVSAANAAATTGKDGLPAKYKTLRAQATFTYYKRLGIAVAVSAAFYNFVASIFLSNYHMELRALDLWEKAEESTYDIAAATKISNATTARDADYAKIQANYNAALAGMDVTLAASFQTCHDQGQGN